MFAKATTVFAGLVAVASAHQTLVYPPPFPGTGPAPLSVDGSNFPCQAPSSSFYSSGAGSTWALGSKQTLSTAGTAVHGGGSAQFSMTYDLTPSKSTKWKVIHTVQGGMPARGETGNREGNSATLPNPDTYDFTVPTNIPAGEAIFAWSWLNRIGNREFYMYCAPVTLTGTGGSQSNFDSLPDMVVLNIMGKGTTTEGDDYEFANPGSSVENNLGKYGFPTELVCDAGTGSACKRTEGGSGSGSDSGSAPAPSSPVVSEPSAVIPGGVFITVPPVAGVPTPKPTATPSVAPAPVPTSDVVVPPVATPTVAPSAPTFTPPAGGLAPPAAGSALTGACTSEGEWNCIDGKSFQQCASGTWSAVMAVAAGTTCSTGQSSALSITAVKSKRVHSRAFRA